MEVLVMRGLPGSGKSTWIDKHLRDNKYCIDVCSADAFWIDHEGEYLFDIKKLGEAHALCLKRFITIITYPTDFDYIVVDNTNIQVWEMASYIQIAVAYGFKVRIIDLCDVKKEVAMERGIHGVPEHTVLGMARALKQQRLPYAWTKMIHQGQKLREFEDSLLRT